MDNVVVYFTVDSTGVSEVLEFDEKGVDRCAAIDGLDAKDQ
jgi:hypothetical protein